MTRGPDELPSGLEIDSGLLRLNRCRHGLFLSLKSDQMIGLSLEVYGEWAEGEIALLSKFLRKGDIVIDAGANIGTHSLAFARMVGPRGRVYSFEPQPLIHQLLCTNAVINGLTAVSAINAGLSDAAGWIAFPELNYGGIANTGMVSLEMVGAVKGGGAAARRRSVPVARLDDILTVDRLRLIKADVEGMEPALLRGARATLARHRPVLYLECRRPEDAGALMAELDGLDYNCFWHVTKVFNPDNWRGQKSGDVHGITEVNMLGVPGEINVSGLKPATGAADHPFATGEATPTRN